MSEKAAPSVSVVVVLLAGDDSIRRCVAALERQREVTPLEILVPFDPDDFDPAPFAARMPQVTFFPGGSRHRHPQLRALGFLRARGDLVALTEDHCMPRPDWLREIVAQHRSTHAAIGGPVEKWEPSGARASILSWAVYLCDFLRYAKPVPEGPATYLTDCNVSYKRGSLQKIESRWRDEFHETEVHGGLRERVGTTHLCPTVEVEQHRELTWRAALLERYRFGRLFASTRARNASLGQRVVFFALSPALFPVLTARILILSQKKRKHRRRVLAGLPAISLLNAAWAAGEMAGYARGLTQLGGPSQPVRDT